MAFLTESRHSEGLCLDAGVSDNLSLAALPELVGPVWHGLLAVCYRMPSPAFAAR